ncbi:MAG: ABC transporter ATP-binding protein [Synergistaceae bacterium]|jgi:iron complex transport system ATP-binding protein|nr:ABC transporter ATP-binding protein [Synergistaceae bacterium]
MLEVEGLCLSIGGREIVKDVSFRVERGEFLAVVGPNGAGKSSLLKCLNRVHPRWKGEVRLNSLPARRLSQKALARQMSYVPQSAGDIAGFTVRQFVEQGRYPWKGAFEAESAEDARIVEEALRLAKAEDLSGRFVESLSGGERQKVLIATALAQDAPLLLLDEPTAYLDYRSQAEVLELIRSIHGAEAPGGSAGRRTVLAVTHDLNFALQAAGRLIVLSEGRAVWTGKPGELVEPGLLERLFRTDFLRFEDAGSDVPFVVPAEFRNTKASGLRPGPAGDAVPCTPK